MGDTNFSNLNELLDHRVRKIRIKQSQILLQRAESTNSMGPSSQSFCSDIVNRFTAFRTEGKKYVHIRKVLTPQECDMIIQFYSKQNPEKLEGITFTARDKRTQHTIMELSKTKRDQPMLKAGNLLKSAGNKTNKTTCTDIKQLFINLCHALNTLHPNICKIEVKVLESKGGSVEQHVHSDNLRFTRATSTRNQSLDDMPFSVLIALEDEELSPTSLVMFKRVNKQTTLELQAIRDHVVRLKQGDMVIFRGDLPHAGASYKQVNRRIFMGVSTWEYPSNAQVQTFEDVTDNYNDNHVQVKKKQKLN